MTPNSASLVHQFLEESARLYPKKTALIHDGARYSYDDINSRANHLARFLLAKGVKKGDRIALIFENCIEYVVGYYGSLKAGAVAVPLSTELKPDGIQSILTELEPALVIGSDRVESHLQSVDLNRLCLRTIVIRSPKLQWAGRDIDIYAWDEVVRDAEDSPKVKLNEKLDTSDLASIIYTSGSTGRPKGVMLSHGNIVSNTLSICEYLHLTDKDIQMVVLPFFYVMGKSLLNTHFAVGGTVVINNKFAFPATVLNEMVTEGVTGFSGVPSTYAYLLHRSPLANFRDRLTSLRYCSQAGGHMSKVIKEKLSEVLPAHTDIYVMYGATEASARLSYLHPKRYLDKMDSIGKAIPGVTLSVLDSDGKPLPAGQTGELVGFGPNIMQGYWKDPDGTSKALKDGWYHTGDEAYMDSDGFFYIAGRKDDLLKVSGHRINPQEIEDILMESDYLVETIVIGIPDDLLGHRLAVLAVPKISGCSENELMAYCAGKLPKYKLPGEIKMTRVLPKNTSGKIDRNKCLELFGCGVSEIRGQRIRREKC